ncbi:MAG: DUF1178 family protein [Candidatus Pelagibacter sp. TMED106]|nr:MAG: DUF1178 family protein [Candidatus Pelagibacter sp. TMED106]|tara:strand:+ start:257 stop:679 length:423 start_codon:yes stop_codon:yes gene_type:complete
MIKYKLICKDCNNSFDSWFSSSKEYDKLKKQKYLNCHFCNSFKIEKTLMSPSVLKPKNEIKTKDPKYKKIKKKMNEYQEFIKRNFKYVGENFAKEARSIHYNDKKNSKGIYGTASFNELKELREEGIETEMIPWFKDNIN